MAKKSTKDRQRRIAKRRWKKHLQEKASLKAVALHGFYERHLYPFTKEAREEGVFSTIRG